MKIASLLVAIGLTLSSSADARDSEGIAFPEMITLGGQDLILNGTATRTFFGFRVYVAGLYVSKATKDASEIMDRNPDPKHLRIVMLRVISEKRFATTARNNIQKNLTLEEQATFSTELDTFFKPFEKGNDLKAGSEVRIDYAPGEGTILTVEGRKLAVIPGREFYHTLLRLWIGKPLQPSIKIGLLRGEQSL
jgi:hypothetical protein